MLSSDRPRRLLVSDFDGTMTQRDFYQVYSETLMPSDAPDFWEEYRAGRITHFDALREIFAYVPASEPTLFALTKAMHLEPELATAVASLRDAGWEVTVVSAGCRWYIDRLFAEANVQIDVHANLGHIDDDGRLIMERPQETPYPSYNVGIDKAAVVRSHQERGWIVAFAGDGPPDLEPALLVPAHLRFARGTLAEELTERNETFHPFHRWLDVAQALAADSE